MVVLQKYGISTTLQITDFQTSTAERVEGAFNSTQLQTIKKIIYNKQKVCFPMKFVDGYKIWF